MEVIRIDIPAIAGMDVANTRLKVSSLRVGEALKEIMDRKSVY